MTGRARRAGYIGVTDASMSKAAGPGRAIILPLALAQFIASYAASNMNVAISVIATDLGTVELRGFARERKAAVLLQASAAVVGLIVADVISASQVRIAGILTSGSRAAVECRHPCAGDSAGS